MIIKNVGEVNASFSADLMSAGSFRCMVSSSLMSFCCDSKCCSCLFSVHVSLMLSFSVSYVVFDFVRADGGRAIVCRKYANGEIPPMKIPNETRIVNTRANKQIHMYIRLPKTMNESLQPIVTTISLATGKNTTWPKLPKLETKPNAMACCFDFWVNR